MIRSARHIFLIALCALAPAAAFAQTDSRMLLTPWPEDNAWGETLDHIVYEVTQADIHGDPEHAQLFWWDSIGRFRLSTTEEDPVHLGYHYVTLNFDTASDAIPNHLDEFSVAVGFKLGEFGGGKVSAILGAGWSGDNPFADAGGIFGVGHLLWQRDLNARDNLVLTLDYNGVGALLPDVPLPGFVFHRRESEQLWWEVGFPRSAMSWEFAEHWAFNAAYEVPFTAEGGVEYRLNEHWRFFGQAANFFEGFRIDDEPSSHRTFFQMSRVEAGIRYVHKDFIWQNLYFDAALTFGYAFDQDFSSGHDVRNLDHQTDLSDEPFIGFVLTGRF